MIRHAAAVIVGLCLSVPPLSAQTTTVTLKVSATAAAVHKAPTLASPVIGKAPRGTDLIRCRGRRRQMASATSGPTLARSRAAAQRQRRTHERAWPRERPRHRRRLPRGYQIRHWSPPLRPPLPLRPVRRPHRHWPPRRPPHRQPRFPRRRYLPRRRSRLPRCRRARSAAGPLAAWVWES
jgi:hypothetical protein